MITVPSYFLEAPHAISISLVGMGGTGSVVLQHLARIHKSLIARGHKGLIVTSFDPDTVEEHNMARQLFTEGDIGMSKAVVLTQRMNRFYSTSWRAYQQAYDQEIVSLDEVPGNIVISCVDNVHSRIWIHKYLNKMNLEEVHERVANTFWIDTGNDKFTGQVLLGSFKLKLPTVHDMYPNAYHEEVVDNSPTCSLTEALNKQDLFVNPYIGLVAAHLVWQILTKDQLNWKGAYVNLDKPFTISRIKA